METSALLPGCSLDAANTAQVTSRDPGGKKGTMCAQGVLADRVTGIDATW